jgi:hypothetical protein
LLLIAVMALSAVGTANSGWCGCDHATGSREMTIVSAPGVPTSCCDRCEPDHECCGTIEDRGNERRADGFLLESKRDDDSAAPQSPPENMLRIATGRHGRVDPAFTIDRFPPHLCTTVLLI